MSRDSNLMCEMKVFTHDKEQEISHKVGNVERLVIRWSVPLPTALIIPRPILIFPFVNQSTLDHAFNPERCRLYRFDCVLCLSYKVWRKSWLLITQLDKTTASTFWESNTKYWVSLTWLHQLPNSCLFFTRSAQLPRVSCSNLFSHEEW